MLNGTLEKTLDSDFRLEDALYTTMAKRRHEGPRAVYNQLNLSPWACFYSAPFAAAADCFDLTSEQRKLAREVAVRGWEKLKADGKFIEGMGGTMVDGVDYARRAWNEAFPNNKVISFRTNNGSNEFYRALILGWAPVFGYFSSKEKVADVIDDGIVQGDTKDSRTYGHLVRVEQGFRVIDNYPTRGKFAEAGRNKYFFDDWDKKLGSGLLFRSAYVFLPA